MLYILKPWVPPLKPQVPWVYLSRCYAWCGVRSMLTMGRFLRCVCNSDVHVFIPRISTITSLSKMHTNVIFISYVLLSKGLNPISFLATRLEKCSSPDLDLPELPRSTVHFSAGTVVIIGTTLLRWIVSSLHSSTWMIEAKEFVAIHPSRSRLFN